MTDTSPAEGLAAALLQISQHAERIGLLDAREGEHYRALSESLQGLHSTVSGLKGSVAGHAEILSSLDGLDGSVTALAAQVAALMPDDEEDEGSRKRYRPIPTVRWWALTDDERAKALGRIRDWVEQIYRPYYGHLAGKLGQCWEEHPLCLVTLDWLSELWSVLHLQPDRKPGDLAGQAELDTRIIPALAAQLADETARCDHARNRNGHRAAAGGAWSR